MPPLRDISGCTNLASVTIPASVTIIDNNVFYGCKSMTGVTIPAGVTDIWSCAFYACTNLSDVYYGGTEEQWKAIAIDRDNEPLTEATIHYNSTGPTEPFQPPKPKENTEPIRPVEDPDFSIRDGRLEKYEGPGGDVTIPTNVTRVMYAAFRGCTGLTSVTIPASVTRIDQQAFYDCTGLTSATILGNVTNIEASTFTGCTNLASVTIPASVTNIETYAFNICPKLKDVYFGGTEAQWKAATHNGVRWLGYDSYENPTIHYNSTGPVKTAYAYTQTVLVDGSPVEFQAYALKDANGNDTNYVKLRDVAQVLNGTAVQFNVGWDGAVNIELPKGYTPNGSEMKTPFSGDRTYEIASAVTYVNGFPASLTAIVLKDDAGGAYTYYKLRDLGRALGFKVDWSAEKGIFVETK